MPTSSPVAQSNPNKQHPIKSFLYNLIGINQPQLVEEQKAAYNNPIPSINSQLIGGGVVTWAGQNAQSFVDDGYTGNDIVYAIVRLITDKIKVAPWQECTVVDEQAYKKYKAIMARPDLIQKWADVEDLRHKALKPVTSQTKISDLLKYPNSQDTWADLVEAWGGYKLITGNSYLNAYLIEAGKNAGVPNELNLLPSQWVQIVANTKQWPAIAVGYELYMGFYQPFTPDEILHDRYFNPQANINGIQLYGMSPLKAAAKLLTRSNEGKRAAVSNYQNGGPASIVYLDAPETVPNDVVEAQAEAIKKRLSQYQGVKNVNQAAVSGYKVGSVPLGLSPVELDLLKAEGYDTRAFCNLYGVPSQLLNDPENKTFNNAKEAEKALTTRCAIPMLNDMEANLNRKLSTVWGYKGKNMVVTYDATVYQELQENRLDQVAWMKDALIPLKMRYELMGLTIPTYIDQKVLETIYTSAGQPIDPAGNITMDPALDPYSDQNQGK